MVKIARYLIQGAEFSILFSWHIWYCLSSNSNLIPPRSELRCTVSRAELQDHRHTSLKCYSKSTKWLSGRIIIKSTLFHNDHSRKFVISMKFSAKQLYLTWSRMSMYNNGVSFCSLERFWLTFLTFLTHLFTFLTHSQNEIHIFDSLVPVTVHDGDFINSPSARPRIDPAIISRVEKL